MAIASAARIVDGVQLEEALTHHLQAQSDSFAVARGAIVASLATRKQAVEEVGSATVKWASAAVVSTSQTQHSGNVLLGTDEGSLICDGGGRRCCQNIMPSPTATVECGGIIEPYCGPAFIHLVRTAAMGLPVALGMRAAIDRRGSRCIGRRIGRRVGRRTGRRIGRRVGRRIGRRVGGRIGRCVGGRIGD